MKQRPDLIVPVRDRRQSRRLLTTKNTLGTLLVATVIFAAVTIRSEMRGKSGDGYGRLFGKQVSSQEHLGKPAYDVVHEQAPVQDQTASDPMLVAPAAREQILLDNTAQATASTATIPTQTEIVAASATPISVGTGENVQIVGGPEGVTIVKGQTKRPTLGGGIFKQ